MRRRGGCPRPEAEPGGLVEGDAEFPRRLLGWFARPDPLDQVLHPRRCLLARRGRAGARLGARGSGKLADQLTDPLPGDAEGEGDMGEGEGGGVEEKGT